MSKKQQKKPIISEEAIEAKPMSLTGSLKSILTGTFESGWKDALKPAGGIVTEQIIDPIYGSEFLKKGEEVSLKKKKEAEKHEEKAEKPKVTSEFMEYKREVINAERVGETRTEMQMRQSVDEIRMEIQKLIKTSKVVEQTVKDATADKSPVKPGKYHINFFEFVLSVLRDATRKLEDTASYGSVFTSKKQQSKYWGSYQKHGTSFGLSGERTVATQTG